MKRKEWHSEPKERVKRKGKKQRTKCKSWNQRKEVANEIDELQQRNKQVNERDVRVIELKRMGGPNVMNDLKRKKR